MARTTRLLIGSAVLACTSCLGAASAQELPTQPNILLIVADDMGYSDVGAYGGEIATPNIDALAETGVMFTDFHANATCSATRAMLLTGMDNHLTGMGRQRGTPAAAHVRAGYEQALSDRAATLPEVLRDAGYRTIMAGKWHLGSAWEQQPQNRGFDHSSVFLEGAGAHYKQEIMGIRDDSGFTFMRDGKFVDVPDDYYSTDYFTDQLIHDIGNGSDHEPFFAYAAYTAPHWPLQAPEEDITPYVGKYDDGWEALASRRIARQKELGLLPENYPQTRPFERTPQWDDLDADQKKIDAREMAVYAGMVTHLDRQIGRLLDHLKQIGEYDNTLIIFMSDNGAEGGRRPNQDWVTKHFDNSLDNIGHRNSFITYGPGWAQAGMVSDRMFKLTPYDGGTHVPAVFNFPSSFPARRTDVYGSVTNIMPTLLDIAGADQPGIRFEGRDVFPMEGAPMTDYLEGESDQLHGADHVYGYELHQFATLRKGKWKILYDPKEKSPQWHLYDMSQQMPERNDLASKQPKVMQDMLLSFRDWASTHNVGLNDDYTPRDAVIP